MFWDGEHWIDESAAARTPARRPSGAAPSHWLAAFPGLLLALSILTPTLGVEATSVHPHGHPAATATASPADTLAAVPAPGASVSSPAAGVGDATVALPTITLVRAYSISQTAATITWTVSVPATGQVEYGTTTAYGSLSTLEGSYRYVTHRQRLTQLAPGRTYHYRTHSVDALGRSAYSDDHLLTTLPKATATPQPPSTMSPSDPPAEAPHATPSPSAAASPTPSEETLSSPSTSPSPITNGDVYGTGIAIDSKDNFIVGGPNLAVLSHRFRASTSSALLRIRWAQRGGTGYSAGTGGSMRLSVEEDVGGLPSGVPLASLVYRPDWPGGTWAPFEEQAFPSPPTLVAGRLYHIVFENTDPQPSANYISVNEVFVYKYAYVPRQPALSDDYAVLYARDDMGGGAWRVMPRDTADMDLTYADGTHDGMGYIEAMAAQAGYVSGTQMVREHFTVSGGDRLVSTVSVRLMRLAETGSNPLVVTMETGAGVPVESVTIPAASIVTSSVGDTSGGTWVTASFSKPLVLANGSTYNLRLSTGPGVTYATIPIREGTDSGTQSPVGFRSYRFTDGDGQRTSNGSTWTNLYQWSPVDLQFFFR